MAAGRTAENYTAWCCTRAFVFGVCVTYVGVPRGKDKAERVGGSQKMALLWGDRVVGIARGGDKNLMNEVFRRHNWKVVYKRSIKWDMLSTAHFRDEDGDVVQMCINDIINVQHCLAGRLVVQQTYFMQDIVNAF